MGTGSDDSTGIAAIDVHGHYGTYWRAEASALECECMSRPAAAVATRAQRAGIATTLVSPLAGLLARSGVDGIDAVAANEEAARLVPTVPGLRQWVIVHPEQPETFAQARRMAGTPCFAGLKIHPEEHGYAIAAQGERLLALAADLGAVVLAHSGQDLSLPADFLRAADRFPEVRLILGHLGNGTQPDLQVRAVQAARHGNLYTDTSSARSLTPGLIEWAVRQIGAERVLFGTDTPLYFAASQRTRIDQAELPLADRRRILRENALTLFPTLNAEPA